MLFTDPCFLFLFLPLILGLYYLSPRGLKNAVLLAASLVFYGSGEGSYLLIILFSIAFNYFVGRWIGKRRAERLGKTALAIGLTVNLFLLSYFKYAAFLALNLNRILFGWHISPVKVPSIALPLGISFFTFHAISYLMDIYRGDTEPMKSPTNFALYITLFPQLIAGPIIRYKTIDKQFAIGGDFGRVHTRERFAEGVRRFIVGLGKKMLIANVIAVAVDDIFSRSASSITPGAAWLGACCYGVQIYFDFSGYTDMAIGMARMFGFIFPENFNYPYSAGSITDFWRRWHMTLTSWFRDYLYIPLGGNRVPRGRLYLNLLVVFFLCGLWHGARWTFVAWGLFHGALLIIERVGFARWLERHSFFRHIYLPLAVTVGWVLFRATSFHLASAYLARMAFIGGAGGIYTARLYLNPLLVTSLIAGLLFSMPVVPAARARWNQLARSPGIFGVTSVWIAQCAELAGLCALFASSAAMSAAGTYNPFIYFRF
jgi:alginate O-acetyltransferase complex protein AlgI